MYIEFFFQYNIFLTCDGYRDAVVSAIIFHPSRVMAVSASYGGDFKVKFFNLFYNCEYVFV